MDKEFKIEPRINPLVDVLNKVSYIETVSSCEGHYDFEEGLDRKKAEVLFNVQKDNEEEFEGLARLILKTNADSWHEALVEINKRYYVVPGNEELRYNWHLIIAPFPPKKIGSIRKREATDRAIEKVTYVIENYAKSYKK
jgi:hypothetical protein